ncbi:sugar ABC transporter ATP-binding protein [Psychrilyobacter sp.]|uniref:sugar ABC transporter ATP-binding protein n=1 Tax=Psychrilyobacter sp. TaxID=2586924 RepID=UPI0030172007
MEYILEARGITKIFPGVKALDNVNFNLKKGEIHALLGENGAGKSTMMKIFSGVYKSDSGKVLVYGEEKEIGSPRDSMKLGIGIIYQELNLCHHLTVAQNIFLGREIEKGIVLDKKASEFKAREILELMGTDIKPSEKVSNLSVSKQQMVEIAKALSQDIKILIMDEPTSSLSEKEVDGLFKVIRKLKSEGKSIIYISHKLDELKRITDRVTIFRDGKFIDTFQFDKVTMNEIISKMVGRKISEQFPRRNIKRGKKILEVKSFSNEKYISNINFELFKGEILGISGIVGSGRTELAKSIFGMLGNPTGKIMIEEKEVKIKSSKIAMDNGIVYIPEDRKKEGLAIGMTVSKNFSLPLLDDISTKILGIVKQKDLKIKSNDMIKKMRIKTPHLETKVKTLSGGNQQKIVIGKWLLKDPKIIILDEPTRGIDVNAKVEIYGLMNDLKERGIGVIMISSELPELLGITDRIMIMNSGKIKKIVDTLSTNQEEIMSYST